MKPGHFKGLKRSPTLGVQTSIASLNDDVLLIVLGKLRSFPPMTWSRATCYFRYGVGFRIKLLSSTEPPFIAPNSRDFVQIFIRRDHSRLLAALSLKERFRETILGGKQEQDPWSKILSAVRHKNEEGGSKNRCVETNKSQLRLTEELRYNSYDTTRLLDLNMRRYLRSLDLFV